MRTTCHSNFQHLRGDLNSVGLPPVPIRRLDEQAHEGQISTHDGDPDRERVPAARGRAVVEQEAHEGHGPGGHSVRERVAVVRVGVWPQPHACARAGRRGGGGVQKTEERERFGAGWA